MRATGATSLLLVALAACRGGGDDRAPAAAQASAAASAAPAASARLAVPPAPRTTDGATAVQNLESQIRGAESLAAREPDSVARQGALVGLLLDHGTFLGRVADLERAAGIAEALVERAPKEPEARITRARARAALHRFREALADLDEAEALGAKPDATRGARASILEALGRLDEALALRVSAREQRAEIGALGAEAAVLGEMGNAPEAERRFAEALAAYRNVSPFPVAWIHFQHGAMWERLGELDRARALYADAHARLPLYAHAAAHLAALEPPARAIEILEPVATSSDDPQYAAQLAEAKRRAGVGGGDALLERARERFEALEKAHPLAFADHAAWFWLGAGADPKRALGLARANAKERPTAAAYELLVAAAAQAGERGAACDAAEEALGLRWPTPKVLDAAARALDACGRGERAAEARRALAARRPAH